jgi:hypothetical protein
MIFFFHIYKNKILITRAIAIVCGLFLLVACGVSRTEKNCANTEKENKDMTTEISGAAQNSEPLSAQTPSPVGQEIASFGMG